MIRQCILAVLFMACIVCGVILGRGDKMEAKTEETEKGCVPTGEYCNMEDLGEMDYYLFCNTQLNKGASGYEGKSSIINNNTQTIEAAKKLYLKFKEQLPLEDEEEENGENDGDEDERTEVIYISPDCKWVITHKWSKFQTITTQILFYEKEKIREEVSKFSPGERQILIVKDGNVCKEMDEEQYRKLDEIVRLNFYEARHYILKGMNEEGNLIVTTNDDFGLLTIRRVEDGTEQWSFDLQDIQEQVRKIRDDVQKGENNLVEICQFEGNEQEGWLVVQAGPSSFFRIAYPSGGVTYLGEYLYSPCFSPDGKYMAYSSVDYDNGVGMDPAEYEQTPPPGIYVWEVETGKTAYMYWHPSIETGEDYMEYRDFMWLEKESFEEYMGYTTSKE